MGLFMQNMKPYFFAMEVKASQTTLWDVVCSPPWEQQKKWVPTGSKSWPLAQMQ
jgi:hypothetical protein